MRGRHCGSGVASLMLAVCGHAGYMLTPSVGGQPSLDVAAGQSFTLDVVLTSDAADQHNSSIFGLLFSSGGLVLEGFEWSSPYVTGGLFDFSKPAWNQFPLALGPDTLSGPGYDPNAVDIELSNITGVLGQPVQYFGTGVLATLLFTVPSDWSGPSQVVISALPDTFAKGFTVIDTQAGDDFVLNIVVPGPAGLLVLVGVVGIGRRSRRRS